MGADHAREEGGIAVTRRVPAPSDADARIVVDGAAIRRWFALARSDLAVCRAQIDALNVFPVADRDTGSNLLATWDAACDAIPAPRDGESPAEVLGPAARAALIGARGNSGAVLCQLLYGLADALGAAEVDGAGLAAALSAAAASARTAIAEPVEGTILTVASAAGAAALAVAHSGMNAVLDAARRAARDALTATTAQLPALQTAGVVDAGGSGYLVILAALRAAVLDRDEHAEPLALGPAPRRVADVTLAPGPVSWAEVQYLLVTEPDSAGALRTRLGELGDSVVLAGGPSLWQVHVHTDDVGAVVESGLAVGQVSRLSVTQLDTLRGTPAKTVTADRVVLAIAPGEGISELFRAAGAQALTAPRPLAEADLRAALDALVAPTVVLLPNDELMITAGHAVAAQLRGSTRQLIVIPTRSPVQGLAALAVADPSLPLADELIGMADAAAATRVGELIIATVTALTMAGTCKPGDVLAMQGPEVLIVGSDLLEVAAELVDRMLEGGGELVTLVAGATLPAALVPQLVRRLERTHPFVEVSAYDGGQLAHPLLVGVE